MLCFVRTFTRYPPSPTPPRTPHLSHCNTDHHVLTFSPFPGHRLLKDRDPVFSLFYTLRHTAWHWAYGGNLTHVCRTGDIKSNQMIHRRTDFLALDKLLFEGQTESENIMISFMLLTALYYIW